MTPLERYVLDFLKSAHPTRWLLEPVRTIRRDKSSWDQFVDDDGTIHYRQFKRNALDRHIDAGCWEILNWRDEVIATPKLWHLSRNNWQKLRCNLARPLGQKVTKHWLLTTYVENQPVNFIQFDLDRHYWDGMTPEEKLQVNAQFERNLENLRTAAQSIGFDYLLTSSPGDIYDDHWVHGAYAWIKLDNALDEYTVEQLRPLVEQFCDFWGLETETQDGRATRLEFSWDKRHRPIRLPGQYRVELLDPETLEIAHPAEKPDDTLAWFIDAWAALEPVQVEQLFAQSRKAAEEETTVAVTQPSPVSILPPNRAPIIPLSRSKSGTLSGRWSLEECLAEGNTFVAATKRKICRDLASRYNGDTGKLQRAVSEGMNAFQRCRPSTSKTCNDPVLAQNTLHRWSSYYFEFHDAYRAFTEQRIGSQLARKYGGDRRYLDDAANEALDLLRPYLGQHSLKHLDKLKHRIKTQWLGKYYFSTFDPAKAKGKGTKPSRDKADRERLGETLKLDLDLVLYVAGRANQLSFDQKSDLKQFMKWWKKYKGRIAAKKLYGGSDRLFSKTQWFRLLHKLEGSLIILDGKDIDSRKCRQWGFSPSFVKRVHETEVLRAQARRMAEKDKEKEVYVTTRHFLAPDAYNQGSGAEYAATSTVFSDICDDFHIPVAPEPREQCALAQ